MRLVLYIILMWIFFKGSAQVKEQLYYDPGNPRVQYAAIVGQNIFFTKIRCTNVIGGCGEWEIFKMNMDLEIVDSLDLAAEFGVARMAGIELKKTEGDLLVYSASDLTIPGHTYIIYLDTNLTVVDTIIIDHQDSVFSPILYSEIDDKVFLGGSYQNYVHYEILDSAGAIVKKKTYPIAGPVTNAVEFNKRIVAGLGSSNHFFMVLEPDLNIDFISSRDPVNWYPLNIFQFVKPLPGSHFLYGLGSAKYGTPAIVKIDSSFAISQIDTFSTFSDSPFLLPGCIDASQPDSIFLLAGEEAWPLFQPMQPGIKADILIYNIDTAGSVNFNVRLGDGKAYLPEALVRTDDGGALIFSLKYDWDLTTPSQTVTSIIRIDNRGNVIGEKEIPYTRDLLRLYPNPTTDKINLEGLPPEMEITAEVYNLNGQKLLEQELGTGRQLSVASLPGGSYLLHLINKEGEKVVRKFVKR